MKGWVLGKRLARYWEIDLGLMEACLMEGLATEQSLGKGLGD